MMNVLIVDDEPIIRMGLRTLIDWEENGLRLVGEASDGEEALNLLSDREVDLLVTDILMPRMDGLELIRQAVIRNPDIGIVVLSCMDDFGYVKEAMKQGARDYILKPTMEPDGLVAVLCAISAELADERREKARIRELNGKLKQSRPYRLQDKLQAYLEHGKADSGLEQELFTEGKKLYSILVCESRGDKVSVRKTVPYEAFVTVRLQGNQQLLLFDCNRGISVNEWYQLGYAAAEKLLRQWLDVSSRESQGPSRPIFCVGPPIQELEDLKNRLDFHRSQMISHFYGRTNDSIHMDDPISQTVEPPLPMVLRNHLLRAVAGGNREAMRSCMEELMNDIGSSRPDLQRLHGFMFETVGLVIGYARENGYGDTQDLDRYYMSMEAIASCLWIEDLRRLMNDFIRDLCGGFSVSINLHAISNPFIRKALTFINDNYRRNIGTTDIADYVKLSRSYLSDLYSKETGQSLIETLTRVRIEAACRLLVATDKKIYEIAEEVGINDSKTFTKSFRRVMGCSPKEYALSNK